MRKFALSLFFVASVAITHAGERPNVLFLFADDWGRYASAYAASDQPGGINEVVRTPNFDKLAGEGVLFRNAHVSAPSCTPCRSSLLTGQHFWRTGSASILLGAVWDDTLPTFPDLMRDAGYHVGYTYKVWGPGTPSNSPFTNEERYHQGGAKFNAFSQTTTGTVNNGGTIEAGKERLYNEVRTNFTSFLADREDDEPFLYWFGPTNVHRKWIKGSGKDLWGIDPDELKGKMPPFLPDVPAVREDLADYFGEVAAWDASIGVLLEELEKSGMRENTLIAVSGDHGAPGFPYGKCNLYGFGTNVPLLLAGPGIKGGRLVEDYSSLTDLAPTFLKSAGLPVPEAMTGKSLWPVLSSDKEGLVDDSRTRVFTGRERHVDNARADFAPYPQRAIRTADHLFIVNFRPDRWPMGDPYEIKLGAVLDVNRLENDTRYTLPDEDAGPTKAWLVGAREEAEWKKHYNWVYGKRPKYELYDLQKDPFETNNVADDPAYSKTRASLEKELMAELSETGDPRLIDNGKFYESAPMNTPAKRPAKKKAK